MIQANELRIGNYVLLGDEHFGKVIAIDSEFGTITTENPHNKKIDGSTGDEVLIKSDFIKGIPISTEILAKSNFISDKHFYLESFILEGIRLKEFGHGFKLVNDVSATLYKVNLIFLHQLQNLYFALTGEELTINL